MSLGSLSVGEGPECLQVNLRVTLKVVLTEESSLWGSRTRKILSNERRKADCWVGTEKHSLVLSAHFEDVADNQVKIRRLSNVEEKKKKKLRKYIYSRARLVNLLLFISINEPRRDEIGNGNIVYIRNICKYQQLRDLQKEKERIKKKKQ